MIVVISVVAVKVASVPVEIQSAVAVVVTVVVEFARVVLFRLRVLTV